MTITEAQLERINHIRERSGSNAVTMQTAEILLDSMSERARDEVMRRVGIEWEINEVLKLPPVEPKPDLVVSADDGWRDSYSSTDVDAAVLAERERCAKIADAIAIQYTNEFGDGCGKTVAENIAAKIRGGE